MAQTDRCGMLFPLLRSVRWNSREKPSVRRETRS